MKQAIYLCKGNTQRGGNYYCVHPWVNNNSSRGRVATRQA